MMNWVLYIMQSRDDTDMVGHFYGSEPIISLNSYHLGLFDSFFFGGDTHNMKKASHNSEHDG